MQKQHFGKLSSFSKDSADQNTNLKLSPANLQRQVDFGFDDYRRKEWITIKPTSSKGEAN